jgi:hypothetical protein
VCVFNDIITCPTYPNKIQRKEAPHITKINKKHLMLLPKIKTTESKLTTKEHQESQQQNLPGRNHNLEREFETQFNKTVYLIRRWLGGSWNSRKR